jgi:hypothetical protein
MLFAQASLSLSYFVLPTIAGTTDACYSAQALVEMRFQELRSSRAYSPK